MKRSLMIFVFLTLVFLSPLFVMGESEPGPSDTWYTIDPFIDVKDHTFVEINWGDEGDLIYWNIDFSDTASLHLIDSQGYQDILDKNPNWESVLGYDFMYTTSVESNIVLPYDDTFYFLLVNKADVSITVDGWYAKDETEPDGVMWGINTNFANEVLIGANVEIGCSFSDHFDIVNISLYENDIMTRTFTGSADTMVEWTISDYKFTTLGIIEVAFKAEDQGRNIGSVSKTVKVVNKLSLPPTTSKQEYFDWVGIFENYWFIIIPIGAVVGIVAMFGLEKMGILH